MRDVHKKKVTSSTFLSFWPKSKWELTIWRFTCDLYLTFKSDFFFCLNFLIDFYLKCFFFFVFTSEIKSSQFKTEQLISSSFALTADKVRSFFFIFQLVLVLYYFVCVQHGSLKLIISFFIFILILFCVGPHFL